MPGIVGAVTAVTISLAIVAILAVIAALYITWWRRRAPDTQGHTSAAGSADSSATLVPAVPTRYDRWMSRLFRGQLDFWGENWADLSTTSQYAAWQRLAQDRGASGDVQYYMKRSLLSELIYAAGGVENELDLLQKALADVQASADQELTQHPVRPEEWPIHGHHISTPSMRDASYRFVNLLAWARSVQERTCRRYRPGASEQVGLLPALAPGQIHDSVQSAFDVLTDALRESRFLTNYALHAGAVPGGGTPRAEILPDGRILARVPDPPTDHVLSWDVFEFTQDRDILTYGAELMATVETFVNQVLDAFEANRPARAGPLPAL
jgi:hypothetical protein